MRARTSLGDRDARHLVVQERGVAGRDERQHPGDHGHLERTAGLPLVGGAERPQRRHVEQRLREQERRAGIDLPAQQPDLPLEVGRGRGDRRAGEERGGLPDRRSAAVASLVEALA